MTQTFTTRAFALTLAGLFVAFGASAEETAARVDAAQNGGATAIDTTPKYNAGLNGRVKTTDAKARATVAQNGGEAVTGAYTQPKYNSALSGRAGAAPTTLAQSQKDLKTGD